MFDAEIELVKLHGSVDWQISSGPAPVPAGRIPTETVQTLAGAAPEKPAIIFGAGNKLRAGGPYLSLFRHFEDALEREPSLLIVGYSFRDDHVNALITNWMNGDSSRRAVILDKRADALVTFDQSSFSQRFNETLQGQNLAYFLAQLKERTYVVNASTAEGLKDAIAAVKADVK